MTHALEAAAALAEGINCTFAARTDVGMQRSHNEDNYLVDRKLRLFVVCDGMGGHAAGEVASAIAVRTLSEEVRKAADLLVDYERAPGGGPRVSKQDVANVLGFAVAIASRRVHQAAMADPAKRGMGTTLAGLMLVGNQAFIVHVGDSRVYLLRNQTVEQLTEDHNVFNEFIKKQKVDAKTAEARAPKQAVTRAVGVYEHCEPELLVIDVADGDRFLLCSDGLSGYFEPPLGSADQLASAMSEENLESGVESLIAEANRRGGRDNVTAVLVAVKAQDAHHAPAHRLEQQRLALGRCSLFDSLNARELRRILQSLEVASCAAGSTVVRQGESSDALHIVLSGRLLARRRDGVSRELGPYDHFGDASLVRNQPSAESIVAIENSELMVMPREAFLEIVRREHRLAVKLLWRLAGVLSDRVQRLVDGAAPISGGTTEVEIHCDLDESDPDKRSA